MFQIYNGPPWPVHCGCRGTQGAVWEEATGGSSSGRREPRAGLQRLTGTFLGSPADRPRRRRVGGQSGEKQVYGSSVCLSEVSQLRQSDAWQGRSRRRARREGGGGFGGGWEGWKGTESLTLDLRSRNGAGTFKWGDEAGRPQARAPRRGAVEARERSLQPVCNTEM